MQLRQDKAGPGRDKRRRKRCPSTRTGFALGMAASAASFFMLNTMNVFAKLLSPYHSAIEVAFYRNLIAALSFCRLVFPAR